MVDVVQEQRPKRLLVHQVLSDVRILSIFVGWCVQPGVRLLLPALRGLHGRLMLVHQTGHGGCRCIALTV